MKKPNYVFDDELYHHGIQGQKWGERRFQNEDGSWTPEGRERYGKGEDPIKKAKLEYKTEKYKMYLKSKEQRYKDRLASKEERERIKQQAKNDRYLIKEQSKVAKKEEDKSKQVYTKEDLQEKINKLNLQIEYNKKLIEAEKPNSALAKADKFFTSPTGKMVSTVITSTVPNLITQTAQSVVNNKLKYDNPLDKAKQKAEIEKSEAQRDSALATARAQQFKAIPDNYEWYIDPKTNTFKQKLKNS